MARARSGLILGINCAYHESAAALVRGDRVVFAAEEERFTRVKHAKKPLVSNPDQLPWNAIRACLGSVPNTRLADLDAIAYSLAPGRRLALVGVDPYLLADKTGFGTAQGEAEFNRRVLGIPMMLAARRMMRPSSTGFTSFLIIAPMPRARFTRHPFRRRRSWWWTASVRNQPRGSAAARPKA